MEFETHEVHYHACLRQLMVIGEAVKQLPDEVKDLEPSVPWSSVAGLRDVLIHGYFSLRDGMLWITSTERVPELLEAIRSILATMEPLED